MAERFQTPGRAQGGVAGSPPRGAALGSGEGALGPGAGAVPGTPASRSRPGSRASTPSRGGRPASRAATPGRAGGPDLAAMPLPVPAATASANARATAGLSHYVDAPSPTNFPRRSLTALDKKSEEYFASKRKKQLEQVQRQLSNILTGLSDHKLKIVNCSYFSLNAMEVEDVLSHCRRSNVVESISLDGNSLGVGAPSTIATVILNPAAVLTELALADCGIDAHGLQTIANGLRANQTLLTLDLRNNELTDSARNYKGLETLTDALDGGGEEGFSFNATLQTLNLSRNCLYDYGADLVADMIAGNEKIAEIALNSNYISNNGLKALIKALRSKQGVKESRLAELELKCNLFDDPKGRLMRELEELLEGAKLRYRALNRIQIKHEKVLRHHMPNVNVFSKTHVHPVQQYSLAQRNLGGVTLPTRSRRSR